jgi:hypothetical protein
MFPGGDVSPVNEVAGVFVGWPSFVRTNHAVKAFRVFAAAVISPHDNQNGRKEGK